MINIDKKIELSLKLNSLTQSDDPTLLSCTYIILDFDTSLNNAVITKEVGLELGESIINKPIVAKYIPVSSPNTSTDNFTGHEVKLTTNKYGKQVVTTDTVPMGVFTTKGYVMTINDNGVDKEVLAADAVLWRSRFSDACDLLLEWYSRGIDIRTSCEYLYKNFSIQDGIEYIHSPVWFEGHAVLASEDRGEQQAVIAAYESSGLLSFNELDQFNKLVAQAFTTHVNESSESLEMEGEKMFFKKVFELSHSDIRSKIYQVLDPTLPEGSYSYIQDVYDGHFVVEIWSESDGYKYSDYTYSVSSDDVLSIDFDSKAEVKEKREWVKVEQTLQTQLNEVTQEKESLEQKLNEVQGSLDQVKTEKETLETSLNEKVDAVTTLESEKEQLVTQFNEASEKLTSLNAEVIELRPLKEQFEQEQYQTALNEKKDYYAAKFNAVSAADKFESEEVQQLIVRVVNQESDAILKLNSMLVDLVTAPKSNETNENGFVREYSSKIEGLIPKQTDFDSKYQ